MLQTHEYSHGQRQTVYHHSCHHGGLTPYQLTMIGIQTNAESITSVSVKINNRIIILSHYSTDRELGRDAAPYGTGACL